MAHSTSFFTRRSGSTKSHTFQRRAGAQITQGHTRRSKEPAHVVTNGSIVVSSTRWLMHIRGYHHYSAICGKVPKGAAAYMARFREANFALLKDAAFSGRAGWTFSPYKVTTRPLDISNGRWLLLTKPTSTHWLTTLLSIDLNYRITVG